MPAVSEVVVIDTAAPTVIVRVAVAVFGVDSVSLADRVTVKVPAVVGVPLIVSVAPLPVAVRPAGSPVAAAQV